MQLLQLLHSAAAAAQWQACVILAVGIVGWTVSGLRRRRERVRLQAAGDAAALLGGAARRGPPAAGGVLPGAAARQQQPERCAGSVFKARPACSGGDWPPLAVVCPVKGARSFSVDNWSTQLGARYDGPRLSVFAAEGGSDPALEALRGLLVQQGATRCWQQQQQPACKAPHTRSSNSTSSDFGGGADAVPQLPGCVLEAWRQQAVQPGHVVLLVQAGLTQTCSQKIHNILTAIEAATPLLTHMQQQQQQARLKQQLHPAKQQEMPQGGGHVAVCAVAGGSSSEDGGQLTASTDGCARAADPSTHPGPPPAAAAPAAAAGLGGRYVCVLDDDVRLHRLSLMQLVDELEAHPDLFMATGYPFDIVAAPDHARQPGSRSSSSRPAALWGRLLSYAAASYHLPLCIGFSAADRGTFVWGGVMLLRESGLARTFPAPPAPPAGKQQQQKQQKQRQKQAGRAPSHTLLEVWRDGGYSDDLLAAGFCGANALPIGLPASALFPQLLPATTSFSAYWNYLRRQLFVLDTYYSPADRWTNAVLMVVHSWSSAMFAIAVLATSLQLLRVLLAVAATAATALAGAGGSAGACWHGGAGQLLLPPAGVAFLASLLLSQAAVGLMAREALALFRVLSPDGPAAVLAPRINFLLLWAGWLLQNALLPACMAHTWLCDTVAWGGIVYRKAGGRVVGVQHPAGASRARSSA